MLNEKELIQMCSEVCARIGYDFTIPVKINKRLTRTLARVKYVVINDYVANDMMEFSYKFLETASINSIWDVIEHECAHYLVIKETREPHGHDAVFKAMCARIGCTNSNATTNIETIISEDKIFKYFVFCDKCKKRIGAYHRAGKIVQHPENYRCKCGGNIHIIQNW